MFLIHPFNKHLLVLLCAQYDSVIDTLDSLDNLDDCIIYIAENFTWRASSDGAKLVMDLLQRKLS